MTAGVHATSRLSSPVSERRVETLRYVGILTRRQVVQCSSISVGALVASRLLREQHPGPPLRVDGTTLESTIVPVPSSGYRQLRIGPPQPIALRTELAPAGDGRATLRTGLAAVVQLTDLHVTDVQNPLRFEYLDRRCRTGHRPQELLGTHGATALVRRVNSLRGGPFTGRPIDAVMTTGDNTDNQCGLELSGSSRSSRVESSSLRVATPALSRGSRAAGSTSTGSPRARRPTATRSTAFPSYRGCWPPRPGRSPLPGSSCLAHCGRAVGWKSIIGAGAASIPQPQGSVTSRSKFRCTRCVADATQGVVLAGGRGTESRHETRPLIADLRGSSARRFAASLTGFRGSSLALLAPQPTIGGGGVS